LNAVRTVSRVVETGGCVVLPGNLHTDVWVDVEASADLKREAFAHDSDIACFSATMSTSES